MIRNFFVALFFFFGPALLMFMARTAFVLFKLWLINKRRQVREAAEVIDVTPRDHHRHPRWYVALVMLVSLGCSIAAFIYLQTDAAEQRHYVPAYTDESGKVVPGHWESLPQPDSGR